MLHVALAMHYAQNFDPDPAKVTVENEIFAEAGDGPKAHIRECWKWHKEPLNLAKERTLRTIIMAIAQLARIEGSLSPTKHRIVDKDGDDRQGFSVELLREVVREADAADAAEAAAAATPDATESG